MSHSTHPTSADHADSAKRVVPVWFDAHNHLHDPRFGSTPEELVASQLSAGICGCVVNATCEDDWPQVADLARKFPDFVRPAFGIHPWKAHTARPGWQDRLLEQLDLFPAASMGECGIDSWIDSPDMEVQMPVFLDQLRIARETGRFLSIHCLKAWGRLFEAFDKEPPPPRFLMHSYSGSLETARRLLPLGAYFSFSGYFLHERKHAVLSVFRDLPPARVLLETDAPDMLPPVARITHSLPGDLNHPSNLSAIGAALAVELGMSPETLAALLTTNARVCFG
jgi:TatD DNase family protein